MKQQRKALLRDEFNYFMENRADFLKKYEGKYLVIKNNRIIGVYEDFDTAIIDTRKREPLGTFLVQKCDADNECYLQTFHSRVDFIN